MNGWKNFRKMIRDNDYIWVHKTAVKNFRKLGWKRVYTT
jgi:hypothetical protein